MAIDELFRQISHVSSELHGLSSGERARKVELRAELAILKEQARILSEGLPKTKADVERDIEQLHLEIARIDRLKVNVVAHAGGSPGGDFGFTKDAMDINRAIDRNHDRDALAQRLHEAQIRLERMSE